MEFYVGGIVHDGIIRRGNYTRWNVTQVESYKVESYRWNQGLLLFMSQHTLKKERSNTCPKYIKGRQLCFNGMLRARFYTKSSANYVSTECFVPDFTPKGAQTMTFSLDLKVKKSIFGFK